MEPVCTNDRPASERSARRARAGALRPGQHRHRCAFDALEDRTLFAGDITRALAIGLATAPMGAAHVQPASDIPAIRDARDAAVASSKVLANGNISVTFDDGSSKVYQKVPHGWSLIAWNHAATSSPGWIEDSWQPDGTFVENYWSKKDHGAAGSADQYSQLTVQNNTITLTLYHAKGVRSYWGLYNNDTSDATVVWTYSRAANGGIGTLQTYHVSEVNSSYAADYISPQSGIPNNYYGSGWLQYLPNNYSVAVPQISFFGIPALSGVDARQLADQAGIAQRNPQTVQIPPGVTKDPGATSPWTVTYRTASYPDGADASTVSFAYAKSNEQDLLYREVGHREGKDWVKDATAVDTNAFKDFITRRFIYDRPGGLRVRSVTVRRAPDGGTVTFHGKKSGKEWLSTADRYLGFREVTIESLGGVAIKRYGTLNGRMLGVDSDDPYAVDSYNKEGTRIVKRQLFARKGGKLLQTWTVSGKYIKIARDDPAPNISHDEFYLTPFDFQTREGNDLLKYDATFKKPVTLEWNYDANLADPTRDSTSYHWWAAYDVPSDSWSYRARGSHGEEHLGNPQTKDPSIETDPPDDGLAGWAVVFEVSDLYWNTV